MTINTQRRQPAAYRSRDRRDHAPQGAVLIAALVCLLVVTSIVAAMLQSTLRARRQLRAERDRRQAELLVDAGAARAAARLAADESFRGDTWQLPADAIVGTGSGQVTTKVSPADGGDAWLVRVEAAYPSNRDLPVRRSRTIRLDSPSTQNLEISP